MHIDLPLHGGHPPKWLFEKMTQLSEKFLLLFVKEVGREELFKNISDPMWFQSLGCYLGFDWHSSGLTTVVGGATSQAIRNVGKEIGLYVAGGKGKISLQTPETIEKISWQNNIKHCKKYQNRSKILAKVDNSLIQDGFSLYYHVIFFDDKGRYSIVQQGMNSKMARRYHRNYKIGEKLVKIMDRTQHDSMKNGLNGDEFNIISTKSLVKVLNLLSSDSGEVRSDLLELVAYINKHYRVPDHHWITTSDFDLNKLMGTMSKIRKEIKSFKDIINIKGIGPKTILNLVHATELIYGKKADRKDPARFSFSHGGKDGTPYPVNRKELTESIGVLNDIIVRAKGKTNFKKVYKKSRLF